MDHWIKDAVFYHIYPLGFCGAPHTNDFGSGPVHRLAKVECWLDHIQFLGATALYLGPVFESTTHGYDTADYYHVDRRLGQRSTLCQLSRELHRRGMHLVLDGVFNHVGRDFWAFRDVLQNGAASLYCDWFTNLRFDRCSPYGDPFGYEGWNNHYELVKLNLQNPAVREHLFKAVEMWMNEFDTDGLRLDAADCLDMGFIRDLGTFCRDLHPQFWLMGEVIHGDYRRWASAGMLDGVTNYEAYKGLYSSLVDRNYFEMAYTLDRQFGPAGIYRALDAYNFVDNHDVSRVASSLGNVELLNPLYMMLFTMPGVPSIYYGSEWGVECLKLAGDDWPLRPCLDLAAMAESGLPGVISRLAHLRRENPALSLGGYRQLHVDHELLVFEREYAGQVIVVAINSSKKAALLNRAWLPNQPAAWTDLLSPSHPAQQIQEFPNQVSPCWGRILQPS
jgi:cyclomaltodextrinase / maltogenic alpha-amylase / neopullulanase